MNYKTTCLLGLGVVLFSTTVAAQAIEGIEFRHHDWELFCSNTGTCQAAGYQESDGEQAVSILLTRKAGPNQAVQGRVAIGDYEETEDSSRLKNLQFYVNGQPYGKINGDFSQSTTLALTKTQVDALLRQSKSDADIIIKNQNYQWQVSSKGMTAALLKMDDFQGRVGTVGALVKKDSNNESKVLVAQPKLIVKKVLTQKTAVVLKPDHADYDKMLKRILTALPAEQTGDCDAKYFNDEPRDIELYSLGDKRQLAMTLCWRGAYNAGFGAWLLDDRQGQKTQFITDQATDFDRGELSGAHKGRGMGDCWVSYQWIWNGQDFVQTVDRWSGMCRMVAAGGVWELDRIEAIVK